MQPLDAQPILLVDDNEDDYDATARGFKSAGLNNPIKWCKSGRDALDYLRGGASPAPALVLLDLNMPGIDGRETLRQIKADDALKRIPVIILTTSANERDVEHCYALGASTYVQKPVSYEGLIDAAKLIRQYWFELALLSGPRKAWAM